MRLPSPKNLRALSRQRALAAGVLIALLATLAASAPAGAETTIGASPGAGPEQGWEFGGIYASSIGQVVTAPAGVKRLRRFTLYAQEPPALIFRAFVLAWNGNPASGSVLYESVDLHTSTGVVFQPFALEPDVPVTAGSQYVLFLSQTEDKAADEGITEGGSLEMVTGNLFTFPPEPRPYTEGGLVDLANGFSPAGWTSEGWYEPFNADARFSATFAAPPAITSIAPASAHAGVHVTITGSEFSAATEVLFGSVPASAFNVVSETEITAEVPSGVSGALDVRVGTSAGESAVVPGDVVTVLGPEVPAQASTAAAQPSSPSTVTAGAPPSPHCVVPYMGGMRIAAVERALRVAHCRLGKVVHHYNTRRRGELVEQNLHQTTVALEGAEVSIWLSRGAHATLHRLARRG